MKLAQRMVNNFCASINASEGHRWTTLSGETEVGVRVTIHKSVDPGEPNGVVLSAATSIWLPVSPEVVFNFFRDERTRPQVKIYALILKEGNWEKNRNDMVESGFFTYFRNKYFHICSIWPSFWFL